MKLSFSAASPFARKVRIAAIELGLIDKIEFTPATVAPGTANEDYSRITPLKKLPVLITDDGDVILDSYVIVEYLNEMAGGSLIPDYGPRRWKAKTNHSLINGMLDSMLLCRYEKMVRPQGLQWRVSFGDADERAVRRSAAVALQHGRSSREACGRRPRASRARGAAAPAHPLSMVLCDACGQRRHAARAARRA
ncbi:glutathione S-transferase N-terminal domain-containing protein [Bradyrhizobium diazoefficiens]|uniref:glutathione S-transferase N-terminal domain-containing protein n=1 Tax=Bradyrhizobium diazoefficiens TaxID=1355477 RepID=UPI001FEE21DA|nr:glutathione S-transferase N-terminal domain-containing protein [Bradyrhizobium diazoefficiens]